MSGDKRDENNAERNYRDATLTDPPMTEPQTDVWVPDYETTLVEVHGQEWPMVLVKKYEVNDLGERRFVESKFFAGVDPALAAREATDD